MSMSGFVAAGAVLWTLVGAAAFADDVPSPDRDILVTFDNQGARSSRGSIGAPYSHRRKYSIARKTRRDATAVAAEYSLQQIDHWPIQSLSIYCYVYRVPEGVDRQAVIVKLTGDVRVESAQPLQSFETSTSREVGYDDTYAKLQYGLEILDIAAAHRTTRGAGIRIAIIDSHVDKSHEDLRGRIRRVQVFSKKGESIDRNHGTAVASIIGARSNNALGIVGVAPEASLDLYVSCWRNGDSKSAICDSFSLSKALDAVLEEPPHVLNLSLTGPHDPLLERLIEKVSAAGVVVVAAAPSGRLAQKSFPSSMQQVIGVEPTPQADSENGTGSNALFAPGIRILVAVPTDQYDFRSGSSLAAAHVSGVVALLLSAMPEQSPATVGNVLLRSQVKRKGDVVSINACDALNLAGSVERCRD